MEIHEVSTTTVQSLCQETISNCNTASWSWSRTQWPHKEEVAEIKIGGSWGTRTLWDTAPERRKPCSRRSRRRETVSWAFWIKHRTKHAHGKTGQDLSEDDYYRAEKGTDTREQAVLESGLADMERPHWDLRKVAPLRVRAIPQCKASSTPT